MKIKKGKSPIMMSKETSKAIKNSNVERIVELMVKKLLPIEVGQFMLSQEIADLMFAAFKDGQNNPIKKEIKKVEKKVKKVVKK